MSYTMRHRHLNPSPVYLAASIDDVIGRGSRSDWAELRRAADADLIEELALRYPGAHDQTLAAAVEKLCAQEVPS